MEEATEQTRDGDRDREDFQMWISHELWYVHAEVALNVKSLALVGRHTVDRRDVRGYVSTWNGNQEIACDTFRECITEAYSQTGTYGVEGVRIVSVQKMHDPLWKFGTVTVDKEGD